MLIVVAALLGITVVLLAINGDDEDTEDVDEEEDADDDEDDDEQDDVDDGDDVEPSDFTIVLGTNHLS